MKFYEAERWQKKRRTILKRDKYLDRVLLRQGRRCEATIVHHLTPLAEAPELAYTDSNLVSVSAETHRRLHNPDGTLSDEGEALRADLARIKFRTG